MYIHKYMLHMDARKYIFRITSSRGPAPPLRLPTLRPPSLRQALARAASALTQEHTHAPSIYRQVLFFSTINSATAMGIAMTSSNRIAEPSASARTPPPPDLFPLYHNSSGKNKQKLCDHPPASYTFARGISQYLLPRQPRLLCYSPLLRLPCTKIKTQLGVTSSSRTKSAIHNDEKNRAGKGSG